jgi:hypothetical protein
MKAQRENRMKSTLMLVVALGGASTMYAQNPLSAELKQGYTQIKNTVSKAADDMPDADYGFVPGPGSRTYGAAVVHVAIVQAALCGMASGTDAPKFEESKSTKADAQAALKSAFAFCDPIYDAMTDADATKTVKMFGRDRTKFGVLDFGIIHDNEMYGTLAVYLRAKDKVPPSSVGRGGGKKKE